MLGKRQTDDAERSPQGDTDIVTPGDAESAAEFFASFFSCSDKADFAYPSFISKSIELFEPGKFIQRANVAADEYLASQGGLDDAEIERFSNAVRANGLLAVVASAQSKLVDAGVVLTPAAVDTVFANDPEVERLRQLAAGCPIDTHPNFIPNWGEGVAARSGPDGDPTKPLLVHALKDARKGKVLLLPLDVVVQAARDAGLRVHVSERFLRDKETDPLGRPIPDYSHSAVGTPPNDPELREVIADRWGQIEHPDISDVCRALLTARQNTPRGRVWGSRVDITAAYTRVLVRPEDVPLLATVVLTNHPKWGTIVSLPLVNQWGHQGAGHAYEVIARALKRRADSRTADPQGTPTGDTYVDDRMQFGSQELVVLEATRVAEDARAALGADAVNENKTIISTRLDMIGWRCNTIAFTISPSPRAILKLIYVFEVATPRELSIGHPFKARHLLRLSSLATRYSRAIVPLRPFSGSFGKNAGGPMVNKAAVRHLTRAALADILAWRSALRCACTNPRVLEVPARWLALADAPAHEQAARADVQVWFDAHGGGGIGLFAPGVMWDLFDIEDTTYFSNGSATPLNNNIFEFIACLTAFVAIAVLNQTKRDARDGLHVHVHTDNTSALAWMRKQRAESVFHTFLLRMMCDLQVRLRANVTISHVPGVINRHADAASRNFQVTDGESLRREIEAAAPRHEVIGRFWKICRPALAMRSPTASECDHAVRTALESVTGTLFDGSF